MTDLSFSNLVDIKQIHEPLEAHYKIKLNIFLFEKTGFTKSKVEYD